METIQVVLDTKLLKATDLAAKRQKVNRSALIRHALQQHLKRLRVYRIATASWQRWRGTHPLLLVAALIGCGSIAAAQTSPQDYPQWRGNDRAGSATPFSHPPA